MKLKTIDNDFGDVDEIGTIHVKYWSFLKCHALAQAGIAVIMWIMMGITFVILKKVGVI